MCNELTNEKTCHVFYSILNEKYLTMATYVSNLFKEGIKIFTPLLPQIKHLQEVKDCDSLFNLPAK